MNIGFAVFPFISPEYKGLSNPRLLSSGVLATLLGSEDFFHNTIATTTRSARTAKTIPIIRPIDDDELLSATAARAAANVVGLPLGAEDGVTVGPILGLEVGLVVGFALVGDIDGLIVGVTVGKYVGYDDEGASDGDLVVGALEGILETGAAVGLRVGGCVGCSTQWPELISMMKPSAHSWQIPAKGPVLFAQ